MSENHGRLRRCWVNMRFRCSDQSPQYKYYKGKGVKVTDEWEQWEVFRDWALANGYDDNLTIDRIDPDKGYEPDNVRFVTRAENTRHARLTIWLEAFGESKPIAEWVQDERCRVSKYALYTRLYLLGWTAETALTTPPRPKRKRK